MATHGRTLLPRGGLGVEQCSSRALDVSVQFLVGILLVASGAVIEMGYMGTPDDVLPRYFRFYQSTGALIDRGMYVVLFSIELGILAEIFCALRAE